MIVHVCCSFFFQAEDGIRDLTVTGVQTCALPISFLQSIQDFQLQQAPVVPSMIQILLGQPLEDYDLSSLRYMVCGAAPLALDVAREFERRVPNALIREGYGCTESSAVISTTPPFARRLGSVGKPIPGYEVAILDDDDKPV